MVSATWYRSVAVSSHLGPPRQPASQQPSPGRAEQAASRWASSRSELASFALGNQGTASFSRVLLSTQNPKSPANFARVVTTTATNHLQQPSRRQLYFPFLPASTPTRARFTTNTHQLDYQTPFSKWLTLLLLPTAAPLTP